MPESTQEQCTNSPLVSVITVVYNDIAHIAQTMDSVVGQSYENLEYIIIDGASSDGTKERILGYIKDCAEIARQESSKQECNERESSAVDSGARFYLEATHKTKNLTFKFLSERDSGIYDAMNKGIDLATGEWCNFMNCGDRFYAGGTIEEFFKQFFGRGLGEGKAHGASSRAHDFDTLIIYGDTQVCYDETHTKILRAKTTNHKYRHHFIHQSAFIAAPLMRHFRYDTRFKIAGDTDFFAKCYNSGARFVHIPLIVSSFNVQGVSSSLSWQMFKEDCAIGYKYNRAFPLGHALWYLCYVIPRVCIRNAIPKRFQNKARILFGKKST